MRRPRLRPGPSSCSPMIPPRIARSGHTRMDEGAVHSRTSAAPRTEGSQMPGHLRRRSIVLPLVLGLLAGLLPQAASAAAPSLKSTVIADGLVHPWDVAFAPDGTMLVTERGGRVRVFSSGAAGAKLVRTIGIPAVHAQGEAGLMGIAVDVDFASNRFVYVCASRDTSSGWRNQVLRYSVRSDGNWGGLKVLIGNMVANTIHNGCALEMDRF